MCVAACGRWDDGSTRLRQNALVSVAETMYAKAPSGWVGYQVVGAGPPDVLATKPALLPVDLMWDEPRFVRFLNGLSSFSRHVWFDSRGTGSSDPITPTEGRLTESFVDDMIAVTRRPRLRTGSCARRVGPAGVAVRRHLSRAHRGVGAHQPERPPPAGRRLSRRVRGRGPRGGSHGASWNSGEPVGCSVTSIPAPPATRGLHAGWHAANACRCRHTMPLGDFAPASTLTFVTSLRRSACRRW